MRPAPNGSASREAVPNEGALPGSRQGLLSAGRFGLQLLDRSLSLIGSQFLLKALFSLDEGSTARGLEHARFNPAVGLTNRAASTGQDGIMDGYRTVKVFAMWCHRQGTVAVPKKRVSDLRVGPILSNKVPNHEAGEKGNA
jgi:hypothetical protein